MSRDRDDDLGDEPVTDLRGPLPDFGRERRSESASGGPALGAIIVIVALVGVGFWWFTGNRAAPAAATSPAAAPAKPEPAPPVAAPPVAAPKKHAAAPAERHSASPPPTPTPQPAAPVVTPGDDATATPAPVAHKAAHKRHKKPPKRKAVKLPRLPNPPPE